MANAKKTKSTSCGTKCKDSVTLGSDPLFPVDPYELSLCTYLFIWDREGSINDETLRFLKNAFKGFKDKVQEEMVKCLRSYFEDLGPEGEQYLPQLGVEHIDLLLQQIVYKIEHGLR